MMRVLTVVPPGRQSGWLVLAIRDSDGALLLSNPDRERQLEWFPAEQCRLGAFSLTADERAIWAEIREHPGGGH